MASLNSLNNLMDIGRNQGIEKVNGQGHLANKGQSPDGSPGLAVIRALFFSTVVRHYFGIIFLAQNVTLSPLLVFLTSVSPSFQCSSHRDDFHSVAS